MAGQEVPQLVSDWPVRPVAPASCREFLNHTGKVPSGDGKQASVTQLGLDHEPRHVSPCHAVQDQLLLHEVVRNGALGRAFDQEMAWLRRMPRRIPDHALG